MIFSFIPVQSANGTVDLAQNDNTSANMSIGYMGMKRAKRNGRNPVTGARTSRKYGISILFLTGIAPLTNSNNYPLY